MGADLSRIRLDPLRDHAGVVLQQGRVLLDADFNELVDVMDRRLRAAASDVLGRATVSSATPDAFRIEAAAGGLAIGRGRMYVDGLLAECHGAPGEAASGTPPGTPPAPLPFDPLMAEPLGGPGPVRYDAQPYLPQPPALPRQGRHLVYLDVWDRELTHVEQPALVDPAVGVDASARRQVAWQVRVLAEDAGNAGCGTPDAQVPGWAAIATPSSARLTTGTAEIPDDQDPCDIPPTGGYRGLENQLYRVEIHDAGLPGAGATFKWSRENASVASRVASVVAAGELELQSLGRDDVLRFSSGDWVEILDDARELSQRSGELRRIMVDDATRRIAFEAPLPADLLPAAFPDADFPRQRQLRVRRWDHRHAVLVVAVDGSTSEWHDLDDAASTGAIPVPPAGTTLLLESGITVRFSSAPPTDASGAPIGVERFRSGDHWVFAARTADASVEALSQASPRGVHHHYARLGFWDAASGAVEDCRTHWPPPAGDGGEATDCGCTRCVTPESHASGALTLQAAVDQVRDTGGTVCLAPGQYALRAPVRLAGVRAVRIRGHGASTLLVAPAGAFEIRVGIALAIEDLAILSLGRAPAISAFTALGVVLQRLAILVPGNRDLRGVAIALAGVVAGMTIRDNAIFAPVGITGPAGAGGGPNDPPDDPPDPPQDAGSPRFVLAALLRIDDNLLRCEREAVTLADRALHLMDTRVAGNQVLGGARAGITLTGLAAPGASVRIERNGLQVEGTGIAAGVDGLWIADNLLEANARREAALRSPDGIALVTGLDPNGASQARLLSNQVRGFAGAGIRIAAPVGDLLVKQNLVARCGDGIVAADDAQAGRVAIEDNQVVDIGGGEDVTKEVVGIGVLRAETALLSNNQVQRVGLTAVRAGLHVGIAAMAVTRLRIDSNQVADIGPQDDSDAGVSVGVLVRPPFLQAAVAGNQVERGAPSLSARGGRFIALWIDEPNAQRPVSRTGDYVAVHASASTTLVLGARRPFLVARPAVTDVNGAQAFQEGSVGVHANQLTASGVLHAALVETAGDCLFGDNRCELRNGRDAAVRLTAGTAIVNANRVRGGSDLSLDIRTSAKRTTVLGNLVDRQIFVDGGVIGAPWESLNIRG